jgi:hypothetical protein
LVKFCGVSVSPAEDVIRKGDFGIHMKFIMGLYSVEDTAPVVSLVYYKGEDGGLPEEPYLPGLTLLDVEKNRCGWSAEDSRAFHVFLATPRAQQWLEDSFKQLRDAISSTKVELPKSLHGILEG